MLASSLKKQLSSDAAQRLTEHPWPGNVRELRNAMERVAVMCRSDIVTGADLNFLTGSHAAFRFRRGGADEDLSSAVERLERRLISEALAESKGNRAEAARRLGINRQLLHTKAEKIRVGQTKEFGLSRPLGAARNLIGLNRSRVLHPAPYLTASFPSHSAAFALRVLVSPAFRMRPHSRRRVS